MLEIGGGGTGIINFFESGQRYVLDPLAEYFKANFKHYNSGIYKISEGGAERLPHPRDFFDLIIMLNVLDHTMDPARCLSEMYRTLKKNGVILLSVHVRHLFWKIRRSFKESVISRSLIIDEKYVVLRNNW